MRQLRTSHTYGIRLDLMDNNYRPLVWPDGYYSKWLEENCIGKWKYYLESIWFEKEEDAIAFKLCFYEERKNNE